MTGASLSVQPRLALAVLLAACVALGGTGCATTSRATTSTLPAPMPEPVAQPAPAPAPEPEPAPAPARAERPKSVAKRSAPKPAPAPSPEVRTSVAARTPEPRRPQAEGFGALSSEPVPFEPSAMTRPQRVSGREPRLTPEARAERVRGTALVRCVVTREGQVKGCKMLNGLPYMDQELLEAVSSWRVTPVTQQGRPLDVEYTFVVRIPAS
ncbi:energy transducer TonB [Archangium violaceum]|uniref:energy transducer TonB n=1 Tax=Archangium violaceum TaxID=83451 RepID=UPI001950EF71|nr:energy transducer TonB [Archangium violaceum]QRN98236.1 energy transducer TonB [Archangium violaceum]